MKFSQTDVQQSFDVCVIGAGPAGLSASLVLGRARRRVLLCDNNAGRNFSTTLVHGYLTRDGIPPKELRELGQRELEPYGVALLEERVESVARTDGLFTITLANGLSVTSRRVIFATGVLDTLPALPGIKQFYGKGAFHCPYCDGWELSDRALVSYSEDDNLVKPALGLKTWSANVTLCTNGKALSDDDIQTLTRNKITVRTERILSLQGDERLRQIQFADDSSIPCEGFFFSTSKKMHCEIPLQLGCRIKNECEIQVDEHQCTNIPGVFVCGDAGGRTQFAISAAAEGATAAVAVNRSLQEEDVL